MQSYTVATVALALGITPKWIDNALSRFTVKGVVQKRQGISRKLTRESVVSLHIAIELGKSLGLPLPDALRIAQEFSSKTAPGQLALFPSAFLTVDVEALTGKLVERLAHAVEVTPVPRRGRPPFK